MMPYDTYRLYQTERPKTTAEIRRADQQAAQFAAAASSLFRALTRPVQAVRTLYPPQRAACPGRPEPLAAKQDEPGDIPGLP